MSNPQTLLASARSAYRSALRASASTFQGDTVVRNGERVCCVLAVSSMFTTFLPAFRDKIRHEVLPYNPQIEAKQFEEKVTLVREIADVLRKNIVQARKVEEAKSAQEKELWGMLIGQYDGIRHSSSSELNIREETELGSNDSIKQAKTQSNRSARRQDGQTK